jgi:hypothetical protein
MSAKIALPSAAEWTLDSGNYTTYAGPVYVSAAHKCIDWGGWIDDDAFAKFGVHRS